MTRILALIAALLLAGCTATRDPSTQGVDHIMKTGGSVTLSFLQSPEWTPGAPLTGRETDRVIIDALDHAPILDDERYIAVPQDVADWAWAQIDLWKAEGVEQALAYLWATYHLRGDTRRYDEYVAEANDCDDYAQLYARTARFLIGVRYGIQDATPAIFAIHVEQRVAWAGVPGGGGHALCAEIIAGQASNHVEIREPQNGRHGPANQYPNKTLRLFGYVRPQQLPVRERVRQLATIMPPGKAASRPTRVLYRAGKQEV